MMAGRGSMRGASAGSGAARHIPVLLDEVIAVLGPRSGATYIDATFGAGGYTSALLAAADCRVLAIDRDPVAVAAGREIERQSAGRLTLVEGRFSQLDRIAIAHGIDSADGVVLDIGVSSMQLDEPGRGFSFRSEGPLDMRMSSTGLSAADVVNDFAESDLADIIFRLGEERRSRAVARAIVQARSMAPIATTAELARIVAGVKGVQRHDGRDPATRTFQALRIYVNDELGELTRALSAAERILEPGGRLAVVTFHSLEDRIVKRFLAARCGRAAAGSRHAPRQNSSPRPASLEFVNRQSLSPGEQEIDANPRARSARLRMARRTSAPAWPEDALDLAGPRPSD
jgi:16S rRNA (cytosine1402-N4)-methyltransferase